MKWLLLILFFLIYLACNAQTVKIFALSVEGDTTTNPPGDTTTIPPPPPRANLLKQETWNGVNPLANWHTAIPNQRCCIYSQVIQDTSQFGLAGDKGLRFALNKTDPDASGSKRTEFDKGSTDPLGAERWVGFADYYPAAFYGSDPSQEIIFQYHHSASTGSPPFAIQITADRFVSVTRDSLTGTPEHRIDLGAVPKDRWVTWVIHYIQQWDSRGLIEIWIDKNGGTPTLTLHGQMPATDEMPVRHLSFRNQTNYLKKGIYKWPWKSSPNSSNQTTRVYYTDNFREGNENATFFDVYPGNY